MKIHFKTQHQSIKKFNDIELPDFTVITGKNGAGKTHFLEGLAQDKFDIEVDDKTVKNVAYFNYVDFIVRQQVANPQALGTLKKLQDQTAIQMDLQEVKDAISSELSVVRELFEESNNDLFSLIFSYVFSHNIFFLEDVPSLEEIQKIVEEKRPESLFGVDVIKEIYDKSCKAIRAIKTTKKLKRYYNIAKDKSVHLMELQPQHLLYNESWLGEQLENEFKNYRQKESDYNHELINKAKQDGAENVDLDVANFKRIHGIPPWEIINTILEEYSCNGYFLDEEHIPHPPRYPNKPESYKIEVWLGSSRTNEKIQLENLSSGEKTLFALALTIYQQKKNGSLPEVLLLDEVDTSLHPSMIRQFLSALQDVFVEKYGMKIILVTHAPSTVALAPEEAIFVIKKSEDNMVVKADKEAAVEILSEGIMTFAEGIKILQAKKPFLYVEGDYDKDYFNKAAALGHDGKKVLSRVTLKELGGQEPMKNHFKSLKAVIDKIVIPEAHVYLFDCDVEVEDQVENNILFKKKIERVTGNPIQKGVENLFPKEVLEKAMKENSSFVIKNKTEKSCGETIETNESWELNKEQKRNLCDWICTNGTKNDFIHFAAIFAKIDDILKTHNSKMQTNSLMPIGWERTRLGLLFDFRNGVNAEKTRYGTGIKFINVMEIIYNNVITAKSIPGKITLNEQEIERNLVEYGDVLFNRTSETPEEIGLAAVYLDNEKVTFGGFVIKGSPITKKLSHKFKKYCFASSGIRKEIVRGGQGVVRMNIGQGDLSKVSLLLPPLPEQEKITEVLETWDSYLDKLAEAIELKKKVKKGLMESLLSGKTQLKGFNDSWHKIKLSEACTINPKSNILPTEFVYIDLESVEKGLLKKERIIKLENAPSRAQRKLKKRDILFQMVRPYQKNNLYFTRDGDYVASTGYAQIRTQNNPEFLYHILHTETFVNRVLDKCTGSNYPVINSTDLGEIEIKLPIIEEQTAIARILTAADQEIEALEKRKGLIEQQRRFLLNNMITGKLRLPEFIKNKPSDRFADLNKTIKKSKL